MSEPEFLSLTETFRREMRRRFPNRTGLHKADLSTFHKSYLVEESGLVTGAIDPAFQPLRDVAESLKRMIRSGERPVNGRENSPTAKLAPIGVGEINLGEIDILQNTLTIYAPGSFRLERRYFDLQCGFGSTSPVEKKQKKKRTPPEQTRALAIIQALFGDTIPPELGPADLLQRLNAHVGSKARPITKDTLRRALDFAQLAQQEHCASCFYQRAWSQNYGFRHRSTQTVTT